MLAWLITKHVKRKLEIFCIIVEGCDFLKFCKFYRHYRMLILSCTDEIKLYNTTLTIVITKILVAECG